MSDSQGKERYTPRDEDPLTPKQEPLQWHFLDHWCSALKWASVGIEVLIKTDGWAAPQLLIQWGGAQ